MAVVNPLIFQAGINSITVSPGAIVRFAAGTNPAAITGAQLINQGTVLIENPPLLLQFASVTQQGGNIQGPNNYPGTLVADLNAGESLTTAAAKPTA